MIQYPTSNLHKKITSNNSSCNDCETICSQSLDNSSFCDKSDTSNNSVSNYCAKEIIIKNNERCNDNGEKIIEFSENHTSGILKITKIKGNLGTAILKIKDGNNINLNSQLFRGILSLSIINNTHNDINIDYNKNKNLVFKNNHFTVFKRKNDCKWEIIMIYEIKNKCENYYYNGKKCEEKQNIFEKKENIDKMHKIDKIDKIYENKCQKKYFENFSDDNKINKNKYTSKIPPKKCNCGDDNDSLS